MTGQEKMQSTVALAVEVDLMVSYTCGKPLKNECSFPPGSWPPGTLELFASHDGCSTAAGTPGKTRHDETSNGKNLGSIGTLFLEIVRKL